MCFIYKLNERIIIKCCNGQQKKLFLKKMLNEEVTKTCPKRQGTKKNIYNNFIKQDNYFSIE